MVMTLMPFRPLVPSQQLVDILGGTIGDALNDVRGIGFEATLVKFAAVDDSEEESNALAAGIGA